MTSDGRADVKPKAKHIEFGNGEWWLYAQVREETKWFFAILTPHGSGADTSGDVDHRFLKIEFDRNNVVKQYDISSSEGTGCNRNGICVRDHRYMLLAPEQADLDAKSFELPGDRCGVYLYGKVSRATSVWMDAHHSGWQVDKDQYFYWQLEAGTHTIAARNRDNTVSFDCANGESVFLELDLKKNFWGSKYTARIERRSEKKGRRAVGKAHRTLMPKAPEVSET